MTSTRRMAASPLATPSRLQRRLAEIDALNEQRRSRLDVAQQVSESGDVFELCARAALGAWGTRKPEPGSEVQGSPEWCADQGFELGYRTACAEMSVVFRAMRRGEPPTKEEMDTVRVEVKKQLDGEEL